MSARQPRRPPGIRFEAPTPPAGTLPRMDVAAFVGLASSGPRDVPVAVESAAAFADVFGGDLAVAWDARRGEDARALLPLAVRAFFQNGGRRCYVVRVAGESAARHRFAVDGLYETNGAAWAPATLLARAVGAWSGALQVGAALRAAPLRLAAGSEPWLGALQGPEPRLSLRVDAAAAVGAGDLVRVTLTPDGPSPAEHPVEAYVLVARVEPAGGDPLARHIIAVSDRPTRWFLAPPRDGSAADPGALAVAAVPAARAEPRVERLEFDLHVREGARELARVIALGFHASHPRYWGALPLDEAAFSAVDPWPHSLHAALRRAVTTPRFPLGSERGHDLAVEPDLPLTMAPSPRFHGAYPQGARAALDGLTSFGDELFLDASLADLLPDELSRECERRMTTGAFKARGVHALWPLDEVTLVAAPDVTHPGWTLTEPEEAPVAPEEAPTPLASRVGALPPGVAPAGPH